MKHTAHKTDYLHTLHVGVELPMMKLAVERALHDHNDDIERKVSVALYEMLDNFDVDTEIKALVERRLELEYKKAIERAVDRKINAIRSEISSAVYDIVSERLDATAEDVKHNDTQWSDCQPSMAQDAQTIKG